MRSRVTSYHPTGVGTNKDVMFFRKKTTLFPRFISCIFASLYVSVVDEDSIKKHAIEHILQMAYI